MMQDKLTKKQKDLIEILDNFIDYSHKAGKHQEYIHLTDEQYNEFMTLFEIPTYRGSTIVKR